MLPQEFTADVVWGLQFQCPNEELFDKEKDIKQKRACIKAAKAETPAVSSSAA